MIDELKAYLTPKVEAVLLPILGPVLDPLHAFLNEVPRFAWHLTACLFLLLGTFWTLGLSRESVYRGAPSMARWRDLRLWSIVVVIPYVLIYALL